MKTPVYEVGEKVGNYTILGGVGNRVGKWEVRCTCGTVETLRGVDLRSKRSCGCITGKDGKDITGKKLNRLTALATTGVKSGNGDFIWKFACECGGILETTIGRFNSEHTKSCGCLAKDNMKFRENYHGMSDSPEYRTWLHMKDRCYNEKDTSYVNYGAKGVIVDPLWVSNFMAFYNHIGKRPKGAYSIDRIDNDKGYEVGNVRWLPMVEQSRNKTLHKNNTTGVCGVRWDNKKHPTTDKYTLYAKAFWNDENGNSKFAYFSTKRYTKEEAFALAVSAREEGIRNANANGAGYSPKHGKAKEIVLKTIEEI